MLANTTTRNDGIAQLATQLARQDQQLVNNNKNTACLIVIQNLKIYSVDNSDSFKRYDLLTDDGKLTIYYINNDLKQLCLQLTNEKSNRKSTYLDIKLSDLNFDEFRFEINKLLIKELKDKSTSSSSSSSSSSKSNKYFYAVESRFQDEKSLLDEGFVTIQSLRSEQTYKTSSISSSNDMNAMTKRKRTDSFQLTNNDLIRQLEDAIRNGNSDDASLYAFELATRKLKIKIEYQDTNNNNNNKNNGNDDDIQEIMVTDQHTASANATANGHASAGVDDDELFGVQCCVIQDTNDNKFIYLDDLFMNMKIGDLKVKVFNEYKFPIDAQYWIINDCSTEDDFLIKFYVNEGKPSDSKFHLFVTSDNTSTSSTKNNDNETAKNDNNSNNNNDNKINDDDIQVIVKDEAVVNDDNKNKVEKRETKAWSCKKCTYRNEMSQLTCEMCNEERECAAPHVKREKFDKYLALFSSEITENSDPFNCDICMDEDLGPREGVVLKECLHVFCKGCLRDHILHSDTSLVKCPFSSDYTCQSHLLEREIRALVTEEEYQKLHLKSLREGEAKLENAFHCKTPNCIGFCISEDDLHHFYCPVCDKTNCIKCAAIHEEKTCDEYKEELKQKLQNDKNLEKDKAALEKMVKNGEAMNCPGCKIIVLKDVGCDWIQCLVCKMEICWATRGPRWGPKGHGDNSGGCKCNFMGKRCSPNCQNCH